MNYKYIIASFMATFLFVTTLSSQIEIVVSFKDRNGDFILGDGSLVSNHPELVAAKDHSGGIQVNIPGRPSFYDTNLTMPMGTTFTPILHHSLTGDLLREVIIEYRDLLSGSAPEGIVIRRFTLENVYITSCETDVEEQATFKIFFAPESIEEEYWSQYEDGTLNEKREFSWSIIPNAN